MSRIGLVLRATAPLALLVVLILPAGASPPGAVAATTPCVAGNPTLADLELAAADDYEGPLAMKYDTDPMLMSEAALDCYGEQTLRFVAYVRDPGAVGWTYPFGLEPAWFRGASFFVAATADLAPGTGPITALAVPPALGDLQAKHVGHWVNVTGHFDDPVAQTCTASGEPGVAPTAAEAVEICRSTFVVSAITRTAAPSTSTAERAMGLPTWWSAWLAVAAAVGGIATIWYTGRRRRRA